MKKMTWLGLMIVAGGLALSGGCQNWQKKYETCAAEKENLQALYESSQDSLKQCQTDMDASQQQLSTAKTEAVSPRKSAGRHEAKETLAGEEAIWNAEKGTLTVALESDVLFDSGKAALKTTAQNRLKKIADAIHQKYADKEIYVIGHTDMDPIKKSKWADNWELSAERALAVTRYLVKHGVSPKKLVAAGRGEFNPSSGSKKAQNRRVEIVVYTF
jgi:chemotaxis protein MotB